MVADIQAMIFFGGILIGIAIGWCWRSFQFAADRDFANPDHGTEE